MLRTRGDGDNPAAAGEGLRRGERLDRGSCCLLGSRCADRAALHNRKLMLANLAGGYPRLGCISNNCAVVAHTAVRGVASHFHKPHPAHNLSVLAPAQLAHYTLGPLGSCLHRWCSHRVHHGAAHLPRPPHRSPGCPLWRRRLDDQAMLHCFGLCPPLHWHHVGYQHVAKAKEAFWRQLNLASTSAAASDADSSSKVKGSQVRAIVARLRLQVLL